MLIKILQNNLFILIVKNIDPAVADLAVEPLPPPARSAARQAREHPGKPSSGEILPVSSLIFFTISSKLTSASVSARILK